MSLQLAPAFVDEALTALTSGTLTCAALLQFLPLPGDVLDSFLSEAADSMLGLLRVQDCVQTASNSLSTPFYSPPAPCCRILSCCYLTDSS